MVDVLRAVATRHGFSPAQVALAWVLSRPAVTSVVVGAKRPDQLADSTGAADLVLTAQDVAELDAVSDPGGSYPQWVWEFAGGGRVPA